MTWSKISGTCWTFFSQVINILDMKEAYLSNHRILDNNHKDSMVEEEMKEEEREEPDGGIECGGMWGVDIGEPST